MPEAHFSVAILSRKHSASRNPTQRTRQSPANITTLPDEHVFARRTNQRARSPVYRGAGGRTYLNLVNPQRYIAI